MILAWLLLFGASSCVAFSSVGVPAYFVPSSRSWKLLEQTADELEGALVSIANPNSGPGTSVDPEYVSGIQSLKSYSNSIVLGYVATGYGSQPISSVKQQIKLWFEWYDVDGIFLDEGASNCDFIDYYSSLTAYIMELGAQKGLSDAISCFNPGTNFCRGMMDAVNVTVPFEDPYKNYASYVPEPWMERYPAERFWHMIHTCPNSPQIPSQVVQLSQKYGAGIVFVTTLGEPNPYGSLPPNAFWTAQVKAANA
jgi:hypothetical protein